MKHTDKLQMCSGLFMQLGLIFSLAFAYFLLEFKTEMKAQNPLSNKNTIEEVTPYFSVETIEIERKEMPKSEANSVPTPEPQLADLKPVDNSSEEPEDIILTTPIKEPIQNPIVFIESEEPEDLENDDHLISLVEEVPVYPGCEKMKSREEKMACFQKNVSKFIGRKFNSDIAIQLGLPPGKQKIYVKFLITSTGEIQVLGAKATHTRLEKEGERVIKLLPKMYPGKQQGQPVNVSYMVPISFDIE